MTRLSFNELLFQVYRATLAVLASIFCIRMCEYSWSQSVQFGVAVMLSFYAGQGIVSVIQNRQKSRHDPMNGTDRRDAS